MLSLDYTHGTSYLDIGEQDYTNTTCFGVAEHNYWSVPVQKDMVKVGETEIASNLAKFAVLDSGTSLMYFPAWMLNDLVSVLAGP